MIIPIERLSKEALNGLIEEFVSREGTDYGPVVYDFEQKLEHVRRQIGRGEVVVVFDPATESCNLLEKQAAMEFLAGLDP